MVFDPFQLESGITPSRIRFAIDAAQFYDAIVMALKLNEASFISEALEKTPVDQSNHYYIYILVFF